MCKHQIESIPAKRKVMRIGGLDEKMWREECGGVEVGRWKLEEVYEFKYLGCWWKVRVGRKKK